MKSHWILVGLATAGIGFTFIASSQEPAPKPFEKAPDDEVVTEASDVFDSNQDRPKQAQVQVEFVEMSHEALTQLLFLVRPVSADVTKLREQVQDMVSKKEAKVLETQIAIARSGQKATTESIHEFIYPTEYEPPKLPGTFTGKSCSEESDADKNPPYSPHTPTAFETRNLGSILEIEPTIGEDGRLVDLRFVPELVWHTGNTVWHDGKDSFGNSCRVQMPDIYTLRLSTSLTLTSGQYALAGVVSPKDDKGETDMTRKVMVFVKCDVLVVK